MPPNRLIYHNAARPPPRSGRTLAGLRNMLLSMAFVTARDAWRRERYGNQRRRPGEKTGKMDTFRSAEPSGRERFAAIVFIAVALAWIGFLLNFLHK